MYLVYIYIYLVIMEVLFILIIFLCFIRLDEIFVYGLLIVEFRLLF